jgi:hypothetical protein
MDISRRDGQFVKVGVVVDITASRQSEPKTPDVEFEHFLGTILGELQIRPQLTQDTGEVFQLSVLPRMTSRKIPIANNLLEISLPLFL